jgi:hypothetical protein
MTHCGIYQFCEETFATTSFVDTAVILATSLYKRKVLMAADTTNAILTINTSFFKRSLF